MSIPRHILVVDDDADLRQMVAEKLFRSDLFYRLNVMTLHVPALRHRLALNFEGVAQGWTTERIIATILSACDAGVR